MADNKTSLRPYMVRALYQWILDNNGAPQIMVDAASSGVQVPSQAHAQNGRLAFNLAPSAVRELCMDGDAPLSFKARFQGVSGNVSVPWEAIIAIHCRDSGNGMVFGNGMDMGDSSAGDNTDNDGLPDAPPEPPPPTLRLVK